MKSPALPALIAALLLGACDREVILQGDRTPIRAQEAQTNKNPAVQLPKAQKNTAWTDRSGTVPHAALAKEPSLIWRADIGAGNSRSARITAAPIIARDLIYTMDSAAVLSATNFDGTRAWQISLIPAHERGNVISGGGLSFGKDRLFAATAYGEVIAISPQTGDILWRQALGNPISSPPRAFGNTVYIGTRDGGAHAINANTGRIIWSVNGIGAPATFNASAAPIVNGRDVIFPSGSGEIVSLIRDNGDISWRSAVAGKRVGRAYAGISAITADPVISGNTLYTGTSAGRVAAIDIRDGSEIWSAPEGAAHAPVVTRNSVFIVNDENRLLRLNRNSGEVIWQSDLPHFTSKKRKAIFEHYGPVLAGGRLVVASSDGTITLFNPKDGAVTARITLDDGAAALPTIANETLFVVSNRGELLAFR